MKGIHVSFDVVNEFIPRIPMQRCPGENSNIPRICVANDVYDAISSIPQAGLVMQYMKDIGLPVIIHVYYLSGKGMANEKVQLFVPDAKITGEFWLTEKPKSVYRVDYEVVNFETEEIKDTLEHSLIVVLSMKLKRCKFQDNTETFLDTFANSQNKRDKIRKIFYKHSYRTVISNIGMDISSALNEHMKCEKV